MKTKKVCVLNPYLPTLGGGEKHMGYLCKFIEEYYDNVEIDILVHNYNNIDIHSDDYITLSDMDKRFGIGLQKTKIRKIDIIKSNKVIDKIKNKIKVENITKEYDLFINFMFLSKHIGKAKKNLYVCMFPAQKSYAQADSFIRKMMAKIADRMFLKSYTAFAPISEYTNHWLNTYWGHIKNSRIINPPVLHTSETADLYKESEKSNIILSVGRFFVSAHCKRQLEMVEMFVKNKEHFKNYEYHLVGALSNAEEDIEYVNKIKEKASQVDNIFIHTNCPYDKLVKLFTSAKIFWHAAGYTVDENREPEKVEHFGISTVEAMSYGAVPVVINKGGQKETVVHDESGFIWNTEEECINYTKIIMEDDGKRKEMAAAANERSRLFSIEAYFQGNKELFDEYKL